MEFLTRSCDVFRLPFIGRENGPYTLNESSDTTILLTVYMSVRAPLTYVCVIERAYMYTVYVNEQDNLSSA